jgi:hypothetical protein
MPSPLPSRGTNAASGQRSPKAPLAEGKWGGARRHPQPGVEHEESDHGEGAAVAVEEEGVGLGGEARDDRAVPRSHGRVHAAREPVGDVPLDPGADGRRRARLPARRAEAHPLPVRVQGRVVRGEAGVHRVERGRGRVGLRDAVEAGEAGAAQTLPAAQALPAARVHRHGPRDVLTV